MIDVGQVYHATLTLKNQAAPPATVTLTITLPDGSTVTPNPGTGAASGSDWVITYDYTTVQAGLHKAAWQTTSPGTAAADYFNVRDFRSVISLAEAKNHLTGGSPDAWTDDDDELRNFLQASTEVVESKVGACVRRTVTERITEGPTLVLATRPVLSVTSVTSIWAGGPSWTTAQLLVDGDAGTVDPQYGAVPFYWGPWDVLLTAGRAVVPERFIHAAKVQLSHLWESQRGGTPLLSPLGGEGETFTSTAGLTFSVPYRVLELLAGDMLPVF
jgi:hypothetical protein